MDFDFSLDNTAVVSLEYDTAEVEDSVTRKVFKPTEEQVVVDNLVEDNDLVKIEAIAGSGKSTTLVYVAENKPVNSLLLVFNKSAKEDAMSKQPSHVTCMTTHGLAYRYVGRRYSHKLSRPVGRYRNVAGTGSEIAKYFKISDMPTQHGEVKASFLGLIIKETVGKYEQSSDECIASHHVPKYHLKVIENKHGKKISKSVKKMALRYAESLWDERTDTFSQVLCTHDTYLKLYALSKPDLSEYKIIYCDEFQDTSDVVIDMVLQQRDKSKLVMVGDSRQAIYLWRGAVNALSKVDGVTTSLTQSFRYGEGVASIAKCILQNKVDVKGSRSIDTKVGTCDVVDYAKPYTMLFRTNMELIYTALQLVIEGEKVNINIDTKDFVNMLKSAESLYNGDHKKVKHENIVPYETWGDLKDEGKFDRDLSRVCRLVENGECDNIIATLHNHRNTKHPHITLTTAHKAKGLEYDQVVLAHDFPSNYNREGEFVGLSTEEENLLYVAATRAKLALQYNKTVEECIDIYGSNSDCSRSEILEDTLDKEAIALHNRLASLEEATLIDPTVSCEQEEAQIEGYAEQANYLLQQEMEANPDWCPWK